jgi:hypothetical protein
MIKISNDIINLTLKNLQSWYPKDEDVYVKILEGYDTVQAPNGTIGFGVYVPKERTIYIPADLPDDEHAVITTIAHEYKHFLQDVEGQEFDEKEAELFAEIMYSMMIMQKIQKQDMKNGIKGNLKKEKIYRAKTTKKEKERQEFNETWVKGDLIHSGGKLYIHPIGNRVTVKGELGRLIVMHEVQPETVCLVE